MSYKSENWQEKLAEVRNNIVSKQGSVEKTADEILNEEVETALASYFAEEVVVEEAAAVDEGKLVTGVADIIKLITKKVATSLEKEYSKSPEKGLSMINTIGAMVGHKVTDDKQQKGKLFLKFGEEVVAESVIEEVQLDEVTDKEVTALKKLSKDMQSVLKGYQSIVKMGDKELKDSKYNKDYQAVLKARDVIFSLIGKVNTQKILNKEDYSLDEEVIVYKVKGIQKPEMDRFKQGGRMMGLKVSFQKKGSDTMVTMTGTKKKLRDFDSIARGKSSYGDASSVQHFDEK